MENHQVQRMRVRTHTHTYMHTHIPAKSKKDQLEPLGLIFRLYPGHHLYPQRKEGQYTIWRDAPPLHFISLIAFNKIKSDLIIHSPLRRGRNLGVDSMPGTVLCILISLKNKHCYTYSENELIALIVENSTVFKFPVKASSGLEFCGQAL